MTPRPIPTGRGRRVIAACALLVMVTPCGNDGPDPAPTPPLTTTPTGVTPTSSPSTAAPRAAKVTFGVSGADANGAAQVLYARLAAFGLNPGDPVVAGTSVTFDVTRRPTGDEATLLTRRGHLTFRGVTETGAATATLGGDNGDCTDAGYRVTLGLANGGPASDARTVVACDATGDAKYVLAGADLTGADVASAEASNEPSGISTRAWVVSLTMRSPARWEAVTEKHVGHQLAIVLDGVVQFAPTVESRIPDGGAVVSGDYTEAQARALAAVLRGGPLPGGAVVTTSSGTG